MIVSKKIKVLTLGIFLLVFLASSKIYSDETCKAIQCDCEAFALDSWYQGCVKAELKQRKRCATGIESNKINACRLQGPDALLPVSKIDVKMVERFFIDQEVSVAQLKRHIKSSVWSLNDSIIDLARLYNQNEYSLVFNELLKRAQDEAGQVFQMQMELVYAKNISKSDSSKSWQLFVLEQNKNIVLLRRLVSDMLSGIKNSSSITAVSSQELERVLSLVNLLSEQKITAYVVLADKDKRKLLQTLNNTAKYNARIAFRLNQFNEKNNSVARLRQWAAEQWYRSSYEYIDVSVEQAKIDYARAEEMLDANTVSAIEWLVLDEQTRLKNSDSVVFERPEKYLNSLPSSLSQAVSVVSESDSVAEEIAEKKLDQPLPKAVEVDEKLDEGTSEELITTKRISKSRTFLDKVEQHTNKELQVPELNTESRKQGRSKRKGLLDRAKKKASK